MLYSFLDFIGYLIMISDHQEVFDLVDTENIVKDVVSDTAKINTIHAQYLVAATNTVLLFRYGIPDSTRHSSSPAVEGTNSMI